MSNELMVVQTEALPAVAKARGSAYVVTSPLTNQEVTLSRNVDFGVVPRTKKPSLYKSGAEKIIMTYGLMCRYTIESRIEQLDAKGNGFFYYNVKCSLMKGFTLSDGSYKEVEYANGFGSANTNESRNGMNSAFNSANATLKMAQKRAMVQAALAVSGLSSMFTMDMEDETQGITMQDMMQQKPGDMDMEDESSVTMQDMIEQKPTDVINSQQRTRMGNAAAMAGMSPQELGKWLSAEGYPKSSQITVQQFEEIVERLKKLAKGEEDNG